VNDRITEEAIGWHEALAGEQPDWDGFTAWLEADPRHRTAFDEVALIDDLVARHRPTLAALPDSAAPQPEVPARRGRLGWARLGAVAAAALLAPMLLLLRPEATAPPQVYATGAAESRQVVLADGSSVALLPASRLSIGERGRDLVLAGAASFDVPHRPQRLLTVRVGGIDLVDIGTRFDVSTAPGMVRVAVAEGRLTARLPDGRGAPVAAGRQLLVDTDRGTAELSAFRPDDLGSWRRGRLVYDNMPLALVAADVGRHAGVEIRINPDVSRRRFSGILTTGNGLGLVRTLAQLMDLEVRPEGGLVRLVPRTGGGRGPAG
jgi:transmembrane sensor